MYDINILVCGAGPLGIFFGGKLHSSGKKVTFLEKTKKLSLLKGSRFQIFSSIERDYSFHPDFTDEVLGLDAQDLILICVKGNYTYEVAMKLLPVIKPSTIVLSLQNGLENESILSTLLGSNLVVGAVPHFSGILKDQNIVEQHAPAQIVFGEMNGHASEREDWLSKIFSHADINHVISRNIHVDIWKKFLWNNSFNTISSLTGTTLGEVIKFANIRKTIKDMLFEGQRVAKSEGVIITDSDLEEILYVNEKYNFIRTSMLKDLESGRELELDSLTGTLLKKAEQYGIQVPINQTIYNLLSLLVQSRD
ncbi:MAG: 2-dehydropantoate 2-reductase [bacterium]|jgi:2-dehydropantoate 2-reductase